MASTTIPSNLYTENATIILDNASAHRGALTESNDEHSASIPPGLYSPFLNPIEKMFSVLKKELREDSICNRIATVPSLISVAEHRIREFLYKHL